MLVDSHCHLDRLTLEAYDGELDRAIAAAHERGVRHMLCVCISEDNKDAVIDIARRYEGIFASVGVHPSDVDGQPVALGELRAWADDDSVVAIGETGLDFYRSREFVKEQITSFARHLIVAGELSLPVIVHTRNAQKETIDTIAAHGNLESAGVMHCFTESWEMAKLALDLNYYISISGIVTFKNAAELREVAKRVPLDRLLIETDAPYLAPVPYRGKPNEPKYVREVADFLSELRGEAFDRLAEATRDNFFRLFGRAKSASGPIDSSQSAPC